MFKAALVVKAKRRKPHSCPLAGQRGRLRCRHAWGHGAAMHPERVTPRCDVCPASPTGIATGTSGLAHGTHTGRPVHNKFRNRRTQPVQRTGQETVAPCGAMRPEGEAWHRRSAPLPRLLRALPGSTLGLGLGREMEQDTGRDPQITTACEVQGRRSGGRGCANHGRWSGRSRRAGPGPFGDIPVA